MRVLDARQDLVAVGLPGYAHAGAQRGAAVRVLDMRRPSRRPATWLCTCGCIAGSARTSARRPARPSRRPATWLRTSASMSMSRIVQDNSGGMDETCPVSTGGWTRRVQSVREGGGGGGCRTTHLWSLGRTQIGVALLIAPPAPLAARGHSSLPGPPSRHRASRDTATTSPLRPTTRPSETRPAPPAAPARARAARPRQAESLYSHCGISLGLRSARDDAGPPAAARGETRGDAGDAPACAWAR
jgi:hypothetical protein